MNRPPLRIAARSGQDANELQPIAAVLIPDQVGGWHAQWRETLQTMKATLSGLEQACDSAIEAREAEVTGLIETLVQGAADAATSAAERTEEQAQIEIGELQQASAVLRGSIETLQAGLEAERDNVKRLSAELASEEAARSLAESERDEVQRSCQGRIAAAEAQNEALRAELQLQQTELAVARQQLDSAFAERSRLTTTFRLVQRALALGTQGDIAAPVVAAEEEEATSWLNGGALQHPVQSAVAETPAEAPDTADTERRALIGRHPEAVEDITRVVNQVSAIYHDDVESGRSGIEVVDRLAASLRHARSLIVGRWSTDDFDAGTLFRHQLDLLLDEHAATSFGRHLGIAAYAVPTTTLPSAPEGHSEIAPETDA